MRLLVALGLVATALAALRAPHHDRYIQGKEYIYKWNAQVLSGLPVAGSSQHSIQQIQSNIHFSLDGEHEAVVYLRNIKLINTHKTVEEPRQLKEVRGEETELTSEQKNLLELPIRFRYHNGIVSEIRFSEEETAWTENIKRSVLNLLQINVNKAEENKQFYNVHEKTIEGDCEVTYSFVPRNEKTEVTKTINFEKCEKRMDVRYNYRFSEKTNEFYGQEETLPESQTVITYTLASTPERLMIEEAQLRSEYVFAPLNKEQKMLSTHITAKIVLEKVTEARRIEEPRYTTRRGDLTFNYEMELARERFWMTGDDDFWMKAGFDKVPRKVETIEKLIIKLIKTVEHVQDGVELHATHEMARIVEWLRMCNKREIRAVHERICMNDRVDERTKKVINDLISDALAIAGTHVTIEHLIEKIRKEEISEPKAVLALKNLVNMRTPSREVVEMILNFLKKDEIRRRPALKQTIMLTWGALINGVCGETKDRLFSEIEEPICTRQLKNDWIREFKRMLEEAEDRYEKVLVLKTMANAGIDTQVHMLEDIIYNKNEETVIRVSAIDALRQLRPKMARKIQNILLPLYKSRSERTHIRMTAVYHLLQTLPERFVIDQVVEQLNKERDQQLFSFTYSLLDGFRRSENPLEKRIARDIEVSLRLLNRNTETYSRHLHMPVYSSMFDMGLSLDFASLFTNESALPQELLASFDSLVSGQWNKQQSQIGLFQTGVDRILMKVVDRLSKTGIKEVVLRGRRASATQPLNMLRDLVEKMNVQSRRSEETPFAMMYLRYKNLDYAVLPVDEEIVNYITKNVLRDGEINFSEIERLMSQGYRFESQLATYLYEQTRVIPTTIGMPLTITTKMPTVASISGHVKVEVDRKMMTPRVRLVVRPQIAATHVTEMLLITPLSHSGVRMLHSVQLHVPVDMKMEINLGKKLIKTTLIVPETEKRVFLFDSRPVTFVRRISENVPETEEKTVFVQKMQKTNVHYEKSFGDKIFGFEMNVFGSVQKHMFEDNFARAILYGENHIQMSYVPKRDSVREFVTEVMLVEEREQDIEGPRYEEESEIAYDVEENFEEKKTEKRDYFKSLKTEKANRYRLVAKAYTVGGPKETKAELTVRQECADNLRYCKWNVICLRSPLFDEKREWEMRAELEAVLPKMPSTLEQLKEQKHREVQLKVDAEWGCEEKNVLKMKVQAEQDKPMREMIKQIRKEERGFLGEEQTLYTVARLNQYRMLVNYDLVPQTERLFSYVKDLFLAKYYWNTEMTSIKGHDGRILVQLNVEPETRRYVNLTIDTAEQRLRLVEVATPIRIPLLNIARPMINKRTLTQTAVCEVSETKIRTFDDLLYKTPLTTCYSVIAKDCSEVPRFAVLMKNVEKNGEEKKVKIVSQDNVIELELIDEEIICRVNKEEVRDEERLNEFGINKINKDLVEVELEYLTVRFDGYTAKVHMSHLMKNKQCGLCGHFDGRADNEFRRPENFEEEDMETFHRSWLSRDSECRMEEDKLTEKKNYRIVEDEFDSEEKEDEIFDLFFGKNQKSERKNLLRKTSLRKNLRSEETYKPEERTLVIEREQKTCFSMEPVAQCENTEEIETSKVEKVRFVCLPKHKPATRRLLNVVRQGELADMTEFEHTQIEKVHVPTLCTVY